MKGTKLAVAATAALSLLSCGGTGQVRVFRVAYEATSPLNGLPSTCYEDEQLPTSRVETTNISDSATFEFFDGADGKAYLDLSLPFNRFGDVNIPNGFNPGIIEGKDKVYSATVTNSGEPAPGSTFKYSYTFEVKLDQLGDVLKGTLSIHYSFTSTNPAPSAGTITDCSIEVPFIARKIDHDQTLFVNNGG